MNKRYLFLLLVIAILVALFFIDPLQSNIAPKCLFKQLTGYSCPGCGIQRAIHAALHGDFYKAIQYNWFLIYSLPYFFSLAIAEWFVSEEWKQKLLRVLAHRYTIYVYILLFLIWGIVRNILNI